MKKHVDTHRADLKSGKLPGRFSYGLGTRVFQHLWQDMRKGTISRIFWMFILKLLLGIHCNYACASLPRASVQTMRTCHIWGCRCAWHVLRLL